MAKNFEEMLTEVFGAVDKIVDVRLQGLEFDKTILCEIIEVSNSSIGEYLVSDGKTKFLAYSKDIEYRVKDRVYVVIPNNDFDQQKNIIGKYRISEVKTYDYISPLESFLKCTENKITTKINSIGLIANNPKTKEKEIWKSEMSDIDFNRYNTLGLRATIQTLLKGFETISGNYGLRLNILYGENNNAIFDFNCHDMYGDPYAYIIPVNQEAAIDISDIKDVKGMSLILYQDCDFIDVDGKPIPYQYNSVSLLENILISNVEIYLGYNTKGIENDQVMLLSSGGSLFSKDNDIQNLYIRWKYGDKLIDSQKEFDECDNAEIHWYQYHEAKHLPTEEKYEDNWFELYDKDKEGQYSPYGLYQYKLDEEGEYSPYRKINWLNKQLDSSKPTQIFKAVIMVPIKESNPIIYKKYESNVLTLVNKNATIDELTKAYIDGIKIFIDEDGYNGTYFLYDRKNKIAAPAEAEIERKLEANIDLLKYIDGVEPESVCWYFPIENTMINIDSNDIVSLQVSEGKNLFIEDGIPTHYKIEGTAANYKIKDTYNINYTNNNIYFQVQKNGTIYEKIIPLSFGPKGSQGVEYIFSISKENNMFVPHLVDSRGKEIDIDDNFTMEENSYMKFSNVEIKEFILSKENAQYIAYYPIPKNDKNYLYYGATTIMYDVLGGSPEYYQDEHKLIDAKSGEEIENVKWNVKFDVNENERFLPLFDGKKLIVPSIYSVGNTKNVIIEATQDDNVIFEYPLRIYQEIQRSKISNPWEEAIKDLTENEKNGKILSSVIGAGQNNSGNFNGVLMGAIEKDKVGLFGYKNNKPNFGFNIDGTAFLGDPIGTNITFDGNSGKQDFISVEKDSDGNNINTCVSINSSNPDRLFSIYKQTENEELKDFMVVGHKDTHIQSVDYSIATVNYIDDKKIEFNFPTGLKFNLTEGSINTADLSISALSKDNNQMFMLDTKQSFPLKIGNEIKFGWDGKIVQDKMVLDHSGLRTSFNHYENSAYRIFMNFTGTRDFTIYNPLDFDESGEWKHTIDRMLPKDSSVLDSNVCNRGKKKQDIEELPKKDSIALFIGSGGIIPNNSTEYIAYYSGDLLNALLDSDRELSDEERNAIIINENQIKDFFKKYSLNDINFKYSKVVSNDLEKEEGYFYVTKLPDDVIQYVEDRVISDSIKEEVEVPVVDEDGIGVGHVISYNNQGNVIQDKIEDSSLSLSTKPLEEDNKNGFFIKKIVRVTKEFMSVEPRNFLQDYFSVTYGGRVFCQRLYAPTLYADNIYTTQINFVPENNTRAMFVRHNYQDINIKLTGSTELKNAGILSGNIRALNYGLVGKIRYKS